MLKKIKQLILRRDWFCGENVSLNNVELNHKCNLAYGADLSNSNVGKFTEEITMTLSGGYSKEIKIPANTLPLDANMQIMAKFEIGDGNFDIEVGVDPDYEALEMKVGSYINAEGKVVRDAADAIGIVFKMEAIGSDVPANYPVALQGKTIAGYAVAIGNVATARQSLNPDGVLTNLVETAASMTNGTQITEALLTSIGDVAFKTLMKNGWRTFSLAVRI